MPAPGDCYQAPHGALFIAEGENLTILGAQGGEQVTILLADLQAWLGRRTASAQAGVILEPATSAGTLVPPDEREKHP